MYFYTGLVLKVFLALLPWLLSIMGRLQGLHSKSIIDFSVISKFFVFQVQLKSPWHHLQGTALLLSLGEFLTVHFDLSTSAAARQHLPSFRARNVHRGVILHCCNAQEQRGTLTHMLILELRLPICAVHHRVPGIVHCWIRPQPGKGPPQQPDFHLLHPRDGCTADLHLLPDLD